MTDRRGADGSGYATGEPHPFVALPDAGAPTAGGHVVAQVVELHGEVDLATLREAIARVVAETTAGRVRSGAAPDLPPVPEAPAGPPLPLVDLGAEADPRSAAAAWTRAALTGGAEPALARFAEPVRDGAEPVRDGEEPVRGGEEPVRGGEGPVRDGAEPVQGGEGLRRVWGAQALLRLGPDRHLWFHQHHRSVVDRFGCALITRRVSEVYTALAGGRPAADGALTTPDRLLATGRPAHLSRPSAPAADPGPEGWHAPVNSAPVTLGSHDTVRVRAVARAAGVPVRAVLTAAVAACAHRPGGAPDPVLGMPVDGRPTRAARRLPGACDRLVPLPLTVRSDATFAELVQHVARASREAGRPDREPRPAPGAPDGRLRLSGPIADIRTPGSHVRFGDLVVVVHDVVNDPVHDLRVVIDDDPVDRRLRIVFSGATNRHDAAQLDARARHFARLLGLAVARPEHSLGTLHARAAGEPAAGDRTVGAPAGAGGRTLTALLESAARRHSGAVAVLDAGRRHTYAELHARANRLARLLLARGAGPESAVGLLLPRGAGALVAMLAVLKAGAAYVPLDPAYPAERLRFMVEDTEPVCVLTDTATEARLADFGSRPGQVVRLDEPSIVRELGRLSPSPPSDADRPRELRPSHPAYVIHTSGSTGTPKGVVVEHSAVVALVDWAVAEFGAGSLARVLAASSFSFDVSVAEIFPALVSGGTVEVAGSLLSLLDDDPPRWSGGLLTAIPSVFSGLLENGGLQVSATTLVMTGETLPSALAARIGEVVRPGTRVLNLYGPTEATVYATAATVYTQEHVSPDLEDNGAPPIGRPLDHVRAHVLDGSLREVETGREGELYLAGHGLARGYLRQPGLTAERFVADPFGRPGERMYRTGDLARRRPDGQLDLLGRADAQVKVNGFRVELGEVEAVIARHPAVAGVMAGVRKGAGGASRLVAHVVPAEGAALPGLAALRGWVAERLPAHLVPAEWTVARELPRTGSGKLDRGREPAGVRPLEAAPPAPAGVRPLETRPPVPAGAAQEAGPPVPADVVQDDDVAREERVARAFAEVLGLPGAPADVSFFDLGGDSMLAIRLLSRLRRAGLVVAPQDIFEHRTARALARVVRRTPVTPAREAGEAPGPVPTAAEYGAEVLLPLRESGDRPPLFCVHAAAGFAWGYAGLTTPLGPDRPVYGLQARGLDGTGALPASVREMAADYLAQVRSVRPAGPYHLLGWSFGGVVAHEMAVQLEESGESVATLAILDAHPLGGGAAEAGSPAAHGAGPAAGRDILGFLLESFGYDPGLWEGESLTYPRVVEITRAQQGPLSSFDEARIAALGRVVGNNARISGLHRPRPFGGDAVMFAAREHSPETLRSLWRPLVTGVLDVLPADCTHMQMGSPAALGGIGRVLAERWAATAPREGWASTS
ncbi:amino acid adenylation domain-containing protein [Streptomyces sp. NPDC015131]|uniref:amino acid adenylation domain-containing protein n=1 Tax=Streptomyces sp. NPDC015131 TaxID=3364941 RepID=UPI0036FD0EEC